MTTVVLSPHFDDAVLSCWSVLTRPTDVSVVNVFTGDPDPGRPRPWDELTGAADPAARQAQRRLEDKAALAHAGRDAINLGVRPPAHELARPHVTDLLAAAIPEGCELHVPAAIGGHPAHVLVRDVGLSLRSRVAETWLYADITYATRYGWPAWVTGREEDPYLRPDAAWARDIARAPLDGAGLEPQVRRLDDTAAEAKLTAARCYVSQWPILQEGPVGRLTHPELRGYELGWRLT